MQAAALCSVQKNTLRYLSGFYQFTALNQGSSDLVVTVEGLEC